MRTCLAPGSCLAVSAAGWGREAVCKYLADFLLTPPGPVLAAKRLQKKKPPDLSIEKTETLDFWALN